jgi:nitrate/nitrite transporter NarK
MTSSITAAITLMALATAAHQGWSANLLTTVSDQFPRRAVVSLVGISGLMGGLGGALLAAKVGFIINTCGYVLLFAIAATAYLAAPSIRAEWLPTGSHESQRAFSTPAAAGKPLLRAMADEAATPFTRASRIPPLT